MTAFLFAATVLIWGTTWIAITAEIGAVPVLVSVFYRFALAAAILNVVLAASRRLSVPAWRHQPFIVAQALCLYCCNFVLFYAATAYISSGLLSVVFSLAALFNAVNEKLLFGTPITGRTVLAAILGVMGVALLFGGDEAVGLGTGVAKGLGLAVGGTMFFSLGNMVSRRNSAAGIPPSITNAWGMAYGSLFLLGLIALTRTTIVPPPSGRYMLALLYLSVFGSVIAFTTYLALVARVGAARAAYTTVLFPIVALTASTLFEGYRWHWTGVLGVAVAITGNVVMFTGPANGPLPMARTGAKA